MDKLWLYHVGFYGYGKVGIYGYGKPVWQYQVNIYGFTKLEPAAIPSFSYGNSKLEAS